MEKLWPPTSPHDTDCIFISLEAGNQTFYFPFFSYSLEGVSLFLEALWLVRILQHRYYSSSLSSQIISGFSLFLLPSPQQLFLPCVPSSITTLHITGATIWLRIIDRLNRVCIQISNGVYVYVRVWVCVWGAAQEETQPPPRPDFPSFHAPSRLLGFEGLH